MAYDKNLIISEGAGVTSCHMSQNLLPPKNNNHSFLNWIVSGRDWGIPIDSRCLMFVTPSNLFICILFSSPVPRAFPTPFTFKRMKNHIDFRLSAFLGGRFYSSIQTHPFKRNNSESRVHQLLILGMVIPPLIGNPCKEYVNSTVGLSLDS